MTPLILTLLAILLLICFYFGWYRNNKVFEFRTGILDIIYESNKNNPSVICWEIFKSVSYESMLYSLKPLKLESFYTEDEIRIMKGENIVPTIRFVTK